MSADADWCAELVRTRDPDRYVASLYAPGTRRPGLLALHALDLELRAVVTTTTDPMVGAIRLAWWRERIEGLGRERADQPVLRALAAAGVTPAPLAALDDAYAAALEGNEAACADIRGRAVFAAAAALLDDAAPPAELHTSGRAWAYADARLHGAPLDPVAPPHWRAPSALRPIAVLAALAWTGAPGQPDGSGVPLGRQLRILAFMLHGRV